MSFPSSSNISSLIGLVSVHFFFYPVNGSYFLFLCVPCKFLLKLTFEYYNVVTLKIRSLNFSVLFSLLAVGCSCLFSDFFFQNYFFLAVILFLCVVSVGTL